MTPECRAELVERIARQLANEDPIGILSPFGHAAIAVDVLEQFRSLDTCPHVTTGDEGTSYCSLAELPARGSWDTNARHRVDTDLFGIKRTPYGEAKVRWVRRLS